MNDKENLKKKKLVEESKNLRKKCLPKKGLNHHINIKSIEKTNK